MTRIYLAGPDVFHPDAKALGAKKAAIAARYGLIGVFPLDEPGDVHGLGPHDRGLAIAAKDLWLARSCDAAIVNLTPYHGPSMDIGTAVELGYMAGLGRLIWGYTNTAADFETRARPVATPGWSVEQFGLTDNLMVDGTIDHMNGQIFRPDHDLAFDDLSVFERCVAAFAAAHGGQTN